MAKSYIKLDFDWHEDPKILDFEDRYGKAALVDVVDLYCILGEFFGSIDYKDNGERLRLQKALGKKGKALESFIDKVAECGIVKKDAWLELRRIGSERSLKDGTARRNRKQYANDASAAAADKRRMDKEEKREP